MINAIPNPKKVLAIDFPMERVKVGVERIAFLSTKYQFTKSNPVFNQYTYEATEFLSLGVYININLSSLSENRTEIIIEIRRKVGTFNQSHEVTYANQHLDNIIELISNGISISESDFATMQQNVEVKRNEGKVLVNGQMVSKNYKTNRAIVIIFFLIVIGFIIYQLIK